jgi:hypothetical protein
MENLKNEVIVRNPFNGKLVNVTPLLHHEKQIAGFDYIIDKLEYAIDWLAMTKHDDESDDVHSIAYNLFTLKELFKSLLKAQTK